MRKDFNSPISLLAADLIGTREMNNARLTFNRGLSKKDLEQSDQALIDARIKTLRKYNQDEAAQRLEDVTLPLLTRQIQLLFGQIRDPKSKIIFVDRIQEHVSYGMAQRKASLRTRLNLKYPRTYTTRTEISPTGLEGLKDSIKDHNDVIMPFLTQQDYTEVMRRNSYLYTDTDQASEKALSDIFDSYAACKQSTEKTSMVTVDRCAKTMRVLKTTPYHHLQHYRSRGLL